MVSSPVGQRPRSRPVSWKCLEPSRPIIPTDETNWEGWGGQGEGGQQPQPCWLLWPGRRRGSQACRAASACLSHLREDGSVAAGSEGRSQRCLRTAHGALAESRAAPLRGSQGTPGVAADTGRTPSLPRWRAAEGKADSPGTGTRAGAERARSPSEARRPHVGLARLSVNTRRRQVGSPTRDPRTAGDDPRHGRPPPATRRTELWAAGRL